MNPGNEASQKFSKPLSSEHKLLFNISLSVRGREEDLEKNYTKNVREKVELPLNQQEGNFIYCYIFNSSED